jgi:hypothetical protein
MSKEPLTRLEHHLRNAALALSALGVIIGLMMLAEWMAN